MSPTLRGPLAGLAGTAVMTLMMRLVAPKVVPEDMRPGEFIPKKAVEWTERKLGKPHALTNRQAMHAAYAAHLMYGLSSGTAYNAFHPRLLGLPTPLAGAMFGVGLWAASFEGWMPALGIKPRTTDKPRKKWPMPIMAHVVFGVTTALVYDKLK